jgi:CRISPR-associated protein Cmr1
MSRDRSARRDLKPEPVQQRDGSQRRIEATLRFITPMFGGGVKLNTQSPHHKEHDRITPVRGASLRGQLRTWWRRTCDPTLAPAVLKAREAVLWGWASTQDAPAKGLVSLATGGNLQPAPVAVYRADNPRRPIDDYGAPLAYGAFPLQPAHDAQDQNSGSLTRWQGDFSVQIEMLDLSSSEVYRARAEQAWGRRGPELDEVLWAEVEQAWLAFTTFGGLGGRTRRGFGAVMQITPKAPTLTEALDRLGWAGRAAHFEVPQGAEKAHKDALAKLQRFRQGKGLGRNDGNQPNRPGRSRWPEPDELRRITNTHAPQHSPEHPVRKFPRAAFGMPIIVHFIGHREPSNQTLQPSGAERLASPLILRPVQFKELVRGTKPPQYNEVCYAVALKLPGEAATERVLKSLVLRGQPEGAPKLSGSLNPQEQADIRPLKGHRSAPESGLNAVLNPFLNYFRD